MILEEDHTGAYISSKLTDAARSWSIETKVHMGIRDNAANMVTYFKHSEQAYRHLSACQQFCAVAEHHLIQDVEMRWNSTFLMLHRIAEQHKALSLYSIQHGSISMLTKTELELVDNVVSVL